MSSSRVLFLRGPSAASRAAAWICAAIVVIIISLAADALWLLRRQAVAAARENAEDHALALAAHASQVFSGAAVVLDSVAQEVQTRGTADPSQLKETFGSAAEHELLWARQQSIQPLRLVAIFDNDGRLVNTSNRYPPPPLVISDREGFQMARDGVSGQTYVTSPEPGQTDPRWTIYLTRKLVSAEGQFLGVVVAGLSCDYFSDFYLSLRVDRRDPVPNGTAMTLVRDDLIVLARAPALPRMLGRQLRSDGRYGQRIGVPAPGQVVATSWDADPRLDDHVLLVTHRIEGFPLSVAVAVRDTVFLAAWWREAKAIGGFAAVGTLLLVATFSVLVGVLRRREAHLAEAERLRRAAEAASRAKSDFLATMSHEIRTPMNGILGTADLLVRAELGPRERSLAETLLKSGRNLLGIIDDILDLSKIEAGELEMHVAPFRPRVLVSEMCDLFAGFASAKGLELGCHVDSAVPEAVEGDADRVRQVLGNLVSNAIKFSDRGEVRIGLAAAPVDGGRTTLAFEVVDHGIGIRPEARARLFQPFAQSDSSVARRFGGTGLGLAISQRLVRMMGGEIHFSSAENEGTRFWFELPVQVAHGDAVDVNVPPAEIAEIRFAHSGAAPLRALEPVTPYGDQRDTPQVLLVEDNAVNAMVAEAQLEKLGCRCDVAVDGEEALACLQKSRYDLVLMDCMLPGLSGYEVTERWREEEGRRGNGRVPIIALTANALASNAEEARQSGMDDFLTKPCTTEKLAAALRKWLSATPAT